MSSKYEFDDTRKAINAHSLQDAERKKMVEKFKKAGGQLLNEKELQKSNKQSAYKQSVNGREYTQTTVNRQYSELDDKIKKTDKIFKESSSLSFFGHLFNWLQAYTENTITFSGSSINLDFCKYLVEQIDTHTAQISNLIAQIFTGDPKMLYELLRYMDKRDPTLIEALDRAYNLGNVCNIDKIRLPGNNESITNMSLNEFTDKAVLILNGIYSFMLGSATTNKAMNMALSFYKAQQSNPSQINKLPSIFTEHDNIDFFVEKWQLSNHILATELPHKLCVFLAYSHKKSYKIPSASLEKTIKFDRDIFTYTRGVNQVVSLYHLVNVKKNNENKENDAPSTIEQEDVGVAEKETKTDEVEEAGSVEKQHTDSGDNQVATELSKIQTGKSTANNVASSKEYQYGTQLMKHYDIGGLRSRQENYAKYDIISVYDKAFLTYMHYQQFEKEYLSFLVSKQLVLYPAIGQNGLQVNYKDKLKQIIDNIHVIHNQFVEYAYDMKSIEAVLGERERMDYLEYGRTTTSLVKKTQRSHSRVKQLVLEGISDINRILSILISDMRTSQSICGGSIALSTRYEMFQKEKSHLNGKTIQECIVEIYCYSFALKEHLRNGPYFSSSDIYISEISMQEFYAEPLTEVQDRRLKILS